MRKNIQDLEEFVKICDLTDEQIDLLIKKETEVWSENEEGLVNGYMYRTEEGELCMAPSYLNRKYNFTKENTAVQKDAIWQSTAIKGFIEYIDEDENPILIAVKAIHRIQKSGDKTIVFSKDGISTIDLQYEEIKSRIEFATS